VFGRSATLLRTAMGWGARSVGRSLLAVALVAGVVEIAARSVEPRLVGRLYDARTTAGHPIELNDDGYRGPLVAPAREADGVRLLALGDSVTFGTGVATEDAWPFALAREVGVAGDAPVDVLNLSGPLADLRQLTDLLERYGASHRPDVAVVMVTGNMVALSWTRADEPVEPLLGAPPPPAPPPSFRDRLAALPHAFALPGLLTIGMEHFRLAIGLNDHLIDPDAPFGVMLAHGIRQGDVPPGMADETWRRFEADLKALRARAAVLGLPVVVAYAPPRFALSERLVDNKKSVPTDRFTIDPLERAREAVRAAGLPFVDLAAPLRAASEGDEPVYVLSDYAHFDRAGHDAIARALRPTVEAARD
ncbi:MAG: GDSL-type esterase/lipase family protein, partial [Myxococcota bacterium]